MNISRHLRPKEASFDLTPMVDVIFLLIIFFTLTSQFTSTTHTPMDLPEEKGEPDAAKETHELVIDLDRDGNIKVLGQSYDLSTLATFLAGREFAVEGAVPEEGLEQPVDVVIRADRACSTASLNALAEVLIQVGVRRWSLATSNEGGG